MNALSAISPLTLATLAIGLVAALALLKWRDKLFSRLGAGAPQRERVMIAPGVSVVVIEIAGKRLACALNRDGVSAMQLLGDAEQEQRT